MSVLDKASAAYEQDVALADSAIAGLDGCDAAAVAAARIRLLELRHCGAIGDKTALDANDRLDAAVAGRAVFSSDGRA